MELPSTEMHPFVLGAFHFLGSVRGTREVQFVKSVWLLLFPGTCLALVLKFTLLDLHS